MAMMTSVSAMRVMSVVTVVLVVVSVFAVLVNIMFFLMQSPREFNALVVTHARSAGVVSAWLSNVLDFI